MPVPKRKRSRARRDSRFANKGLKIQAFSSCSQCQEPLAPHQACKNCGFYKGKKVLKTKVERTMKRAEQMQKKQEKKASAQTPETSQE
jgi:large subunit ribosomal protein L32